MPNDEQCYWHCLVNILVTAKDHKMSSWSGSAGIYVLFVWHNWLWWDLSGLSLPYLHTGHWKWQRCEVRDIPFVIQPHFVLLQYGIIIPVTTVKHLPRQSWVTACGKETFTFSMHTCTCIQLLVLYKAKKNSCRQSICPNDFQCSVLAPVAMGLPASDTHLILPTNQTVNYKYYLKFGLLKLLLHNSS